MFTLHTDGSCPELSNCFSHGESRRVTGFMSRIIEFLFTRRVTESLGIYVTNYRIIEFLFSRKITEVFFVTRHVLGHEFANYRISFFTRNVADGRGGYEGGTIEA